MKIKRLTAVIAAISIAAAMLTGCQDGKKEVQTQNSKKTDTDIVADTSANKKENTAMGRYVEKTIELPQMAEGQNETIIGMVKNHEGTIVLYSYRAEDNCYLNYSLQGDGSWSVQDAQWLNETAAKDKGSVWQVSQGDDNQTYAWYRDGSYNSTIVHSPDGIQGQDTPMTFKKEESVNGFKVLQNGDILVSFFLSGSVKSVLYDKTDRSTKMEFEHGDNSSDNFCNSMDVEGNKFLTISEDNKGYIVYNTETGEKTEEIKEGISGITEYFIQIAEDGNYYLLNSEGLQHLTEQGSILETIIDGSLNSMGIPGNSVKSFVVGNQEDYYVLFGDEQSNELARYVYDETVPTVPTTQITLYGLEENDGVLRAIGVYQKEHPDVQIEYRTAESEEGAVTLTDSIRSLNTELIGGKGADILLLDGLPMDAYVEKGVLADISDVIAPMLESNELLQNIVKSYQKEDGKIYAVPSRFSVPIIFGDTSLTEAVQSLDSFNKYLKENPDSPVFPNIAYTVTYEELEKLILNINYKEIIGDGKKLQKENIVKYLETVMACIQVQKATKETEAVPPATQADLNSYLEWKKERPEDLGFRLGYYPTSNGVSSVEVKGLMDLMEPTTIVSDYGKTMSTLNDIFVPYGTVGINNSTEYMEEAKDFIRILLSESEQNKDIGTGLPVNAKAIENWCEKQSNSMVGVSGSGIETLTFDYPTKEEIQDFMESAKALHVPLNVDRVFLEMIISEAGAYFEGTITADKAADAILSKANTYLAE